MDEKNGWKQKTYWVYKMDESGQKWCIKFNKNLDESKQEMDESGWKWCMKLNKKIG